MRRARDPGVRLKKAGLAVFTSTSPKLFRIEPLASERALRLRILEVTTASAPCGRFTGYFCPSPDVVLTFSRMGRGGQSLG